MRLFLAIKPDRPAEALLARRLLQAQEWLGPMASALRWTPAENIHVTLHFLGELPATEAATVRERLGTQLAESPFEITLGAIGSFPPTGPCRVLWLDLVDGNAALLRVHAELGRRLADAGVPLESRPLSPHLTIARVPDRERARVTHLRDRLREMPSAPPIRWTAEAVVLYRSELSGPAPRYEPLQTMALIAPGS